MGAGCSGPLPGVAEPQRALGTGIGLSRHAQDACARARGQRGWLLAQWRRGQVALCEVHGGHEALGAVVPHPGGPLMNRSSTTKFTIPSVVV